MTHRNTRIPFHCYSDPYPNAAPSLSYLAFGVSAAPTAFPAGWRTNALSANFQHAAFYNERLGRIEMHIESLRSQTVRLDGTSISFTKGETVHTENSYKYSIEEFRQLAERAGFDPTQVWTDAERLFSLHYLTLPA